MIHGVLYCFGLGFWFFISSKISFTRGLILFIYFVIFSFTCVFISFSFFRLFFFWLWRVAGAELHIINYANLIAQVLIILTFPLSPLYAWVVWCVFFNYHIGANLQLCICVCVLYVHFPWGRNHLFPSVISISWVSLCLFLVALLCSVGLLAIFVPILF